MLTLASGNSIPECFRFHCPIPALHGRTFCIQTHCKHLLSMVEWSRRFVRQHGWPRYSPQFSRRTWFTSWQGVFHGASIIILYCSDYVGKFFLEASLCPYLYNAETASLEGESQGEFERIFDSLPCCMRNRVQYTALVISGGYIKMIPAFVSWSIFSSHTFCALLMLCGALSAF